MERIINNIPVPVRWRRLLVILILVALSLFFLYFFYLIAPVGAEEKEEEFTVERGESLKMIARSLKERNLIRSATAFKIYSFLSGSAHRLKPGKYTMSSHRSSQEIVGALTRGVPEDVEVLIVEGATLQEIDQALANVNIIERHALERFSWSPLRSEYEFLLVARDLEGFLFPDTYRFFPNSKPEEVVRKFLDNFKRQAAPLFLDWEREHDGANFYDRLILASLIEKEVPFPEDRFLVAGVLDARLEGSVPLQVDASVVYAVCKGVFKGCRSLTSHDLKIPSPFNTYTRRGLPPMPIGSPGLTAITAALNPQPSDFFYYLSDPRTKKTIFSKTLGEHAANRRKYLSP